MTDRDGSAPRGRLGPVVGMLVRSFEEAIYGIAFLLLAAAAVLVVIGTFGAVIQVVTCQVSTLEGGVLVVERTLLILIIAELAYTLRTDFLHHEIAAEPFLYIGLIATVRRMLIVTAEFEQPQSEVRMEFAYDGGGMGKGGDVTLYCDGKEVGKGRVDQTQGFIFSADETTDVGNETGTTVSPDYTAHTSKFNGTINWVRIDLGEDAKDADHYIDPDERLRVAMARQ